MLTAITVLSNHHQILREGVSVFVCAYHKLTKHSYLLENLKFAR